MSTLPALIQKGIKSSTSYQYFCIVLALDVEMRNGDLKGNLTAL